MSNATRKLLGTTPAAAGGQIDISEYFSTYLYTGNGSTQTITNGIDLAGEGGLVWVKSRTNSGLDHWLQDTERDAFSVLYSNLDVAAGSLDQGVTSYNSNGFSLGNRPIVNDSGDTFASWTFRKAPRFFDVVTYAYQGNASNTTAQIPHNLGVAPGMILIKAVDKAEAFIVWHKSVNGYFKLNETSVPYTATGAFGSTTPDMTDSYFTVGYDGATNFPGYNYVAYLFAHDPLGPSGDGSDGLIACGSYTGNSSTDGPEIDLGWEPQWILIKRANLADDWVLFDNMRGIATGGNDVFLKANTSDGEQLQSNLRLLPNGFKLEADEGKSNSSGSTYIYIAIRRGPMRAPTSGTEVLESVAYTGDGSSNRTIGSSLTPDFVLWMDRDATSTNWSSYGQGIWDRIRGEDVSLATSNANSEAGGWANQYFNLDQQVGWSNGSNSSYINNSGTDYVTHHLRRAPGFFDVVAYTGDRTSTSQVISHNLKAVPELIIAKNRSEGQPWSVYSEAVGNTKTLYLEVTNGAETVNDWNNTSPTETNFTVGDNSRTNNTGDSLIAYLFATLPGVSKVGSYTGNGSSQTINCGFTSGARFILIKRTDSTGDWYVWDTARGIVTGNDPFLELNTTDAEVTSDDSIDPDSSGFIVNQTATTNVNVSSASYIFYSVS
jgi:hypothetical protein